MKARREAWFELQPDLDPTKLLFLDETGATTKMARLRGRSPRGERCRAAVPHGHWKTTTLIAGLRLGGLTAPMVIDGAMNGEAFTAYAETFLAPTLSPGDVAPRRDRTGRARNPPPLRAARRMQLVRSSRFADRP